MVYKIIFTISNCALILQRIVSLKDINVIVYPCVVKELFHEYEKSAMQTTIKPNR